MKKNKIKLKKLFTTLFLIISIFTPLLGFNTILGQNISSTEKLKINYDKLVLPSELKDVSENPMIELSSDYNIFDNDLYEYLKKQDLEQENIEKIKIIVMFKEEIDKSERIQAIKTILNDYEIIDTYDIIPGVSLSCNPKELISKADKLEEVSLIEKIYKSKHYTYPFETPKASALNNINYPNWWIPAIGADNLAYDGSGVRVAIIDTGIYEHPDLNVVASQNFISEDSDPFYVDDLTGHGTHCAGIVGSDGDSSGGKYRGVAPGVSLINAKAGSFSGLEDLDIIDAIDWCVDPFGANASIISMSFGGGYPDPDDPLAKAISNAGKINGVITVASAGNSGPNYFTGSSPASGSNVISVGATDSDNNLASFSSWGPTFSYLGYPDVIAPGVYIISTEAPDSVISEEERYKGDYFDYSGDADYIPLSGTSMACPMVAGALAILKDAYPSITPETARIALLEGATKLEDHNYVKHGAGIINVSESLDFLNEVNVIYGDINNISKFFPDELPTEPFDLLHFPGDTQSFNLTLLSGITNIYDINIPSEVDGLSISVDKPTVTFSSEGIDFVTLDIAINMDAEPGIRPFELNITSGTTLYDTIEISVDVKLPEYKILMESYHGLNDFFPELSFYQMRFYDAMDYLSELNISIDYNAEYWTPYYDKNTDNSLLTEEKLAQYDLVVLQTPILPYSPLEIKNLKTYFDTGGNLLFLGTRHQELCKDNLNELFNILELDLQISEQSIVYENWLGIGLETTTMSVTQLNSSIIFNGVEKFVWSYGNTFTTSGNINSLASIGDYSVVAAYDDVSPEKGKFLAFGDLHWLTDFFLDSDYQQDHKNLLKNLVEYYLYQEDISMNLALNSERTATPQINLSVYAKDQISETPISSSILNSNLSVSIKNNGYSEIIQMNSSFDGFSGNNSFILPSPRDTPYIITVNLTIGAQIFSKSTKLLYYDISGTPNIISQPGPSTVFRGDTIEISSELDQGGYEVDAYMALYSYGVDYLPTIDAYAFTHPLYNSKKTLNKTLDNLDQFGTTYRKFYDLSENDSAGFIFAYIVPRNTSSNYYNPFSQRFRFSILNNDPIFNETSSTFSIDDSAEVAFEDTYSETYTGFYQASQGSNINFNVKAYENALYEDKNMSNMSVSVNFFICTVSEDNYVVILFPNAYPIAELSYQATSDTFSGSLIIPHNIQYSSIDGLESISTVTNFNPSTGEGYLAILYITVKDSDGGLNDFVIIFQIEAALNLVLTLIISLIVIGISIIILVIFLRKRKKSRKEISPEVQQQYYTPYSQEYYQAYEKPISEDQEYPYQKPTLNFCPYCGYKLKILKNFCPNCGKKLEFYS